MNKLKLLALILVVAMCVPMLASCMFLPSLPEFSFPSFDFFEKDEEQADEKADDHAAAHSHDADHEASRSQGAEVGDNCCSADLPLTTQSGTVDPSATGEVTLIYFWGTWCTPSIVELDSLDRLASEYDNVSFIAVHSDLAADSAPDYVDEYFPDSRIIFANDPNGEYYDTLGGKGVYPRNVILDEDGKIIYNGDASLTEEDIREILDDELN